MNQPMSPDDAPAESAPADSSLRSVAVIDIGATSVRMEIAQISAGGAILPLTRLVQAVDLGKDAFSSRRFQRGTIEQTVSVLRSYQQVLREFGIDSMEDVRVVATSAVREAVNRLQFLDRVYIATGLQVDTIDEAEVNRITYMGIQPHLERNPKLASSKAVVVEVGGGSTELLVVRSGNVLASETYRLGAMRLAQSLEHLGAPLSKRRAIMENQIGRTVSQIQEAVRVDMEISILAIGGDVRFAADHILPDWDGHTLAEVPLEDLKRLTDEVVQCDQDQIVRRYGVSFAEAETLAPALLTYVMLAEAFGSKRLYVSDTNLRDGLLHEMAVRESLTAEFRNQILRSAITLGRKFDFDETFARHTAELASKLFDSLRELHGLDQRFEVILHVAALLHEIGHAINDRSNHKHAMYIIRNSELFGLTQQDLLLTALLARYHRRAFPQPSHEGYANLDRDHRVVVCKLAAMLRIAIALNASRSGRIKELRCDQERERIVLHVPGVDDVSLELLAMRQNRGLFEDVFGKVILLRPRR